MVKIGQYPLRVTCQTNVSQYGGQLKGSNEAQDVEMKDTRQAMEQKLVLRRGLRRKRSRTDSVFGTEEEMTMKRIKLPDINKTLSEGASGSSKRLTILARGRGEKGEAIPLYINRQSNTSQVIARTIMSDWFCDWKTALPKPIDLTDEDPSLVEHYVGWKDTRNIATRRRPQWVSQQERSQPECKQETVLDTELLALCYGLGERLEDSRYRNAILCVLRYFVAEEGFFPSDYAVATIYKHTCRDSPARKMMVDFWTYAGNTSWLENGSVRSSICPEFFDDLLSAMLRVRQRPDRTTWPWANNTDAYLVDDDIPPVVQTIQETESMEL